MAKSKIEHACAPQCFFDNISDIVNQPSLFVADQIGKKVSSIGFDWHNAHDAFAKITEEVGELKEAIDKNDLEHAKEELGDLLFSIAQVARHLGLDAEQAGQSANNKFIRRFLCMLDMAGSTRQFQSLALPEMMNLWQKSKTNK